MSMRTPRRAKPSGMMMLAALTGFFGGALVAAARPAHAGETCEYNICFVALGQCGVTDWAANCTQTTEETCKSSSC